tara:strand:+ start:69 stop:584 length:516 start_codon:yes stop_codon:yes gene_type:complete
MNEEILGLDDESNDYGLIYLISNEEQVLNINKNFVTISTMLDNLIKGDNTAGLLDNKIKLSKVNTRCLEYIITYMKHHKGIDKDMPTQPLKSVDMHEVMNDSWDADFINSLIPEYNDNESPDLKLLVDMILSANYLHMTHLLHKLCAKIASLIRGKDEDEIPNILQSINND